MMPQDINNISDWLIESALVDRPVCETINSFAKKLKHAGLFVDRINCSTFQRHQIMGAVDTTWERETGQCQTEFVPKSVLSNPDVAQNPVGAMARGTLDFERHDLADPVVWSRFPMLKDLNERGYSDYVVLKQSYGRHFDWADTGADSEGVYGSFATKQDKGFSQTQIAGIKSVWRPFSLNGNFTSEREPNPSGLSDDISCAYSS